MAKFQELVSQSQLEKCISKYQQESLYVFMTGAPGSGKSYFLKMMEPSCLAENMVTMSYDIWQWENLGCHVSSGLAPTRQWIGEESKNVKQNGRVVICDAMHQPAIVRQAALLEGITNFRVIYLTCSDDERKYRLGRLREQPELATEQMCQWAEKLKDDAINMGATVLDTGRPPEQVASDIRSLIIQTIIDKGRH